MRGLIISTLCERWVKPVGILAVIAMLLATCAGYGDKITRLKGELYFTRGILKGEAELIGDWLVATGYFDSATSKSVQIERILDTVHFRFVIRPEFREEQDVERFMTLAAYEVSHLINDDRPAVAHISNNRFRSVKAVPLRIVRIGGEVIFTERVDAADAGSLAEFLRETGFFADTAVTTVLLDKGLRNYLFKFVSKPGIADDASFRETATTYARSLSRHVFDGAPVDFYFVDSLLITRRVIYFSDS